MTDLPYASYPATVWATCWQSLSWLQNLLNTTSNTSQIDDPTRAVFQTLLNGINAIDAWLAGAALTVESQNLLAVQALPITLDVLSADYFNARVAAIQTAAIDISKLPTVANPLLAVKSLSMGQPAIADPGFLEWCMTFQGEMPISGTLLPSGAVATANAWLNVVNAISMLQGGPNSQQYDTAARMYRCSLIVANVLSQVQSGPYQASINAVAGAEQLTDSAGNLLYDNLGNPLYSSAVTVDALDWNGAAALPTFLLDATSLTSHPALIINQQAAVIRYILMVQMQSLALLLLALRTHNVVQPSVATLRNGESLADLAARTTGNFDDWPELAAINSIKPPYPGPTNQALALAGTPIFTTNTGLQPDPDAVPATYASNVLGIDWDFGPINGTQPSWSGDINLITGYQNFARSIGRRLQTPLGALIFHSNYGSRIPPEVGAVQSVDEAPRLLQYGNSAVLSDPRTGAILSSQATTQPGFLATYSAIIQSIGPGAESVSINATIGSQP